MLPTGRLGIDMGGGARSLRGRGGRGESSGLAIAASFSLGGGGGSGLEGIFLGVSMLSRAGGGAGRALEKRDLPPALLGV
jgi:hypothetical protein